MGLSQTKNYSKPKSNQIEISLFGPGYGECIVIHIGLGKWIIVDSCIDTDSKDPIVVEYLENIDVNIEQDVIFLICTHWHDDHIRGFHKLVQRCKSAKVCISLALKDKEFLQLITAYSENMMMENPGANEIYKTFNLLCEQNKIPLWASQDRTIFNDDLEIYPESAVPVKIATLSPSDLAITKAQLTFKSLLPEIHKTKRGLSSHKINDSSVVTYVEIGEISLLLGGDIEVTSDKRAGWDCIINNRMFRTKKSLVYKVSHHGSETGHHESVWRELLNSHPISILTPFRKGSIILPTNNDLERLISMNGDTYLTSWKSLHSVKKRNRTIQKTINEVTRKHSSWLGKTGQIRIRIDIKNLEERTIELSENSILVDKTELKSLGVCRIYDSRLDFCPFHLLLRWRNAHLAQLNSAFAALHQVKIIKNRLEIYQSDRLLEQ